MANFSNGVDVVGDTSITGDVKSTERIDGIVATIMSLDRALKARTNGSVYDDRDLIVL
jgi:hypothetical protein